MLKVCVGNGGVGVEGKFDKVKVWDGNDGVV